MCWFSPAENAVQSIFVLCAIWLHGEANQRGTRNRQVVVNYWGDTGVSTLTMNNSTPEDKQAWEKGGVGKKYQEGVIHNKIVVYSSITVITGYNTNTPLQQRTWITGTQFKLSPSQTLLPRITIVWRSREAPCCSRKAGPPLGTQGSEATATWHTVKQSLPKAADLLGGAAAAKNAVAMGFVFQGVPSWTTLQHS